MVGCGSFIRAGVDVRLTASAGIRLCPFRFSMDVKPGGRRVRTVDVTTSSDKATRGLTQGTIEVDGKILRAQVPGPVLSRDPGTTR